MVIENTGAKVRLAGTLTTPFKFAKAAVILITGSGTQDRDETIMGHKPFAVIADYLTKKDFAVLRLDDRGIGGSTGNPATATTADFVTDISAAVDFLKSRSDIPSSKIGLIGHSEGGMIAPMLASRRDDIAFMILLAGPGIKTTDLMIQQRYDFFSKMGVEDEKLELNKAHDSKLFNAINEIPLAQPFDQKVNKLIEKSARLLHTGNESELYQQVSLLKSQYSLPWFRFFFRYDPEDYLSKTKIPVLAINGTLDIQVAAGPNLRSFEKLFIKYQYPDYEVTSLEQLNHLFQTAKTGSIDEYAQIEETFAEKALIVMSDWLNKRYQDKDCTQSNYARNFISKQEIRMY